MLNNQTNQQTQQVLFSCIPPNNSSMFTHRNKRHFLTVGWQWILSRGWSQLIFVSFHSLIRTLKTIYFSVINLCKSLCKDRNFSVSIGAESNSYLHLLDCLGPLHWLLLLVGKKFWQLLTLTQTPPADSQYLPLIQYNLFILLQSVFKFRCQD